MSNTISLNKGVSNPELFSQKPMVSVQMITYNHEKYIAEAIEGVLRQKTSFRLELVIGEDCSNDSTREICEEYSKKYPEIIKLLPSENNLGMMRNHIRTFKACRGKYIALCEGDDYWTDPYKLQKQVDFLESNPDYGMVYSKVKIYIEKDKQFKKQCFGKSISSFEDLLLANYIATPTVLFRKEMYFSYLEEIQPDQQHWLMGDYPLWLWIAANSKIKYFDDVFSVYRVLESSATHSIDFRKEILFVESYHAIKLFYTKKLGYSQLEKKIWESLFISKAHIYTFKNEENISELVKEINDFNVKTFKLNILKLLLNNWLFRKILKLYWNI